MFSILSYGRYKQTKTQSHSPKLLKTTFFERKGPKNEYFQGKPIIENVQHYNIFYLLKK